MLNYGPQIAIEFDDPPEFFTNGDHINGRLIVNCSRSFNVQYIEVKLRCENVALVMVPDAQGSHAEEERLRFLSLRNTLFPTKEVRCSTAAAVSNANYTMQAGKHEFKFQFQIPITDVYPQSFNVAKSNSGVKWYVKAKLSRGQVFSAPRRDIKFFEMRPSVALDYNRLRQLNKTLTLPLNIYLPGYAANNKTPSGLLKGIVQGGNSQFRKISDVSCILFWPEGGLLQDPAPLNVSIEVNSQDDSALLIRHFSLGLKRKITIKVKSTTNPYKEFHPLVELKNIESTSLKEGLEIVRKAVESATIKGRIPSTFSNHNFDIEYKLVAVVSISSRERPKSVEKFRISVPLVVCPYMPMNRAITQLTAADILPEYSAEDVLGLPQIIDSVPTQ